MSVPTEALSLVKCTVCNKYLSYFPISLDENQQPICGRCSILLTDNKNHIRDTAYEALAQFLKFPCIYHSEGCVEHLLPVDMPNHEKNCPYKIIFCSLDCMWQGSVHELLDHFEEMHPNSIIRDGEFELDILKSYKVYSLLVYEDELFWFKRKFDDCEHVLECSVFCHKMLDSVTKYKFVILIQNGNRTRSEKFGPKPAEDLDEENVIKINIENMRNKLDDPSIMIGTVKVSKIDENESKTEKKPDPSINFEMLSELECPVCFEYIIPPIFQCVTGHSICGDCKAKVTQCPSCKEEIKNTQNFTLEKMAFLFTYPCKYNENGCDFAAKPVKIKQHQKYCIYGTQECVLKDYVTCNWKGASKDFYSHALNCHHDNILEIDSVSLFIDNSYFEAEDCECYILRFANSLFKLHYSYRLNCFYWAMQLIGPPEEARSYKFEIDILDNNNSNQKIFLRNFCAPQSDKNQSFVEASQYVFLQRDQIASLMTDMLTYRVRIVK